jgi:hypothetical protein
LDDPVLRPSAGESPLERAEVQATREALLEVEAGLEQALAQQSLADLRRRAQASPLLTDAPRAGTGFQI